MNNDVDVEGYKLIIDVLCQALGWRRLMTFRLRPLNKRISWNREPNIYFISTLQPLDPFEPFTVLYTYIPIFSFLCTSREVPK